MIRRKNALFAHFPGKLVKLKIFHAQFCTHIHILFFLITTKYIKKKKYIYFQTNNFPKKVVTAITDICTGGQQCKYQLLGSGVNISYYLHWGDFFFVIVLTKYEGMHIEENLSLSNFAHTYILAL